MLLDERQGDRSGVQQGGLSGSRYISSDGYVVQVQIFKSLWHRRAVSFESHGSVRRHGTAAGTH